MSAKITMLAIWTLPTIRTNDPISPTERANDSAAPDRIAGRSAGSTTRLKIVALDAPRLAAASSASRSTSSSTGWTERTTNGSVTNRRATNTIARVYARWMPNGLPGPYSASSVRPATIVGSANGRSISALMIRLPGKSSRTRTHATIVPITAPTSATTTDTPRVTPSARTASVLLTDAQSALGLWAKALTTTAA